jgi:concentrative nucleoside transporter, CNT family
LDLARLTGLIGIAVIIGIAWALSNDRRAIPWRTVGWGLGLQVGIAIAVLKGADIAAALRPIAPLTQIAAAAIFIALAFAVTQAAKRMEPQTRRPLWIIFAIASAYLILAYNLLAYFFEAMRQVVNNFIAYTAEGSRFVFGDQLSRSDGPAGFVFATQVLPTIIFISSVFAVLYYLGVMQVIVRFFAKIMTRTMKASGAEATSTAASVFMGQTEAPLTIRPFLADVTMSELMVIMVSGMATVSGAIMAAYVLVAGVDIVHLLTASIMAAPAAIMLSKIIVPEKQVPKTGSEVNVDVPVTDVNVIDAAGRGAIEGLYLALNVAGMLIAFIALVALIDGLFGYAHGYAPWFPASLSVLLGWMFSPIAWMIGVPWRDALEVGNLLGTRMVLNEFVAFLELGKIREALDPKSLIIATYALCGFANFSSIAIQIGGIGSLAPTRRSDIARLGLRAMIAGTLANFLTASIAGILL